MTTNPSKGMELPVVVNGYPVPATRSRIYSTYGVGLGLIVIIVFGLMIHYGSKQDPPGFKLNSVSVSVHANYTAVWDIGYSIYNGPVEDLQVWARFMGRDFVAQSSGSAGRHATVSLNTTFPANGTIVTALERVTFMCNKGEDFGLKAVCKNVFVGINLKLQGGSRWCP